LSPPVKGGEIKFPSPLAGEGRVRGKVLKKRAGIKPRPFLFVWIEDSY